MSDDKFWQQWTGGSGQKEPADDAAAAATTPGSDPLAEWLQSTSGDELVPPVEQRPATVPGLTTTGDSLAAWPPPEAVDPFAGMQQNAPPGNADWDLALDLDVSPAPPVLEEDPGTTSPGSPVPPPVSEFDLGDLAGPVPGGDPFAASAPSQSAAAAPVPASPFGPPPPPPEPPAEALAAPPLKLEISVGRRTWSQDIRGEALIGRPDATRGLHPEIDLRLDDAVSRRHAKIFVRDGKYVLTDLNSTNGTRHNREWLQPESEVALQPGDEVEVGEMTLIRVVEAPDTHA